MLVLRRGLQAVRACWLLWDMTGSTLGFCHFQQSGAGGGGLWFILPLNTAANAQTLGKGDELARSYVKGTLLETQTCDHSYSGIFRDYRGGCKVTRSPL